MNKLRNEIDIYWTFKAKARVWHIYIYVVFVLVLVCVGVENELATLRRNVDSLSFRFGTFLALLCPTV
jgi:hypothetical protein